MRATKQDLRFPRPRRGLSVRRWSQRSEEHTSELQSQSNIVCRLLLEKKSANQGSNVPNPEEAVPSFDSGAIAKAGKGLVEGTLQAGTSADSDNLLDLV